MKTASFLVSLLLVVVTWFTAGWNFGYQSGYRAAQTKRLVGEWNPIGDRGGPRLVFDVPADAAPYRDATAFHLHCPEELNGGGYRAGKFTYTSQRGPAR